MSNKPGKSQKPRGGETSEPKSNVNSTKKSGEKAALPPVAPEGSFLSREAVESIVVAIVLALLFRAFEAEAFVIPTGSMAPTLLGRNRDLECGQCGYLFPFGDSEEQAVPDLYGGVCPLCGFCKPVRRDVANDGPANGDRILVNKFAYQFWEPERWDVIVFKNPGNPKQNYIKRLVGLPNERLRIHAGDVFVRPEGSTDYAMARKPADKLQPLLRLVHHTDHIPPALTSAAWPPAWRPATDPTSAAWTTSADQRTYTLAKPSEQIAWLHYEHSTPLPTDWNLNGSLAPTAKPRPRLITDFSGYNIRTRAGQIGKQSYLSIEQSDGYHWVSDLAVECQANVVGDAGHLVAQLIEAGGEFTCDIDIATGLATVTCPGGLEFADEAGKATSLTGQTSIRGAGTYTILFSNVDDQLYLWVNGSLVELHDAENQTRLATYTRQIDPQPVWTADNPGDLHPVRVGAQGVQVELTELQVSRDVYYIAVDNHNQFRHPNGSPFPDDYDVMSQTHTLVEEINQVFATPAAWAESRLFESRRTVEFDIKSDQFFPLGDNSAVSQDARLWPPSPNADSASIPEAGGRVDRDLLIGKAFLVYWPHGWNVAGMPWIPNVRRMGSIR